MTHTTKRTVLGLVAATAVIIVAGGAGAYATAQDQNTNPPPRSFMGRHGGPGGPGGMFGPMGGMLPRFGRALQLTDAQRDQIKAIGASHRDEWKALGARARTAHQGLQAAVTADAIDESLIRQKSAEVAAVDADLAVARAHAHAEVLQILTAEQKTKLTELKAQMQSRMQSRGAK